MTGTESNATWTTPQGDTWRVTAGPAEQGFVPVYGGGFLMALVPASQVTFDLEEFIPEPDATPPF